MTETHPVTFSTHAEGTTLPAPTPEQRTALDAAGRDPASLRDVASRWPALLDAWADLAEVAQDPVTSYAYARVGYHRGLDALRRAGWRGSGRVYASEASNLGFLRSLNALRHAAGAIGELDEEARCEQFLDELDPAWRERLAT
jgi:Protein of unknown function (DUF3151)